MLRLPTWMLAGCLLVLSACTTIKIQPGVSYLPSKYLTLFIFACNETSVCGVTVELLMNDGSIVPLGTVGGQMCRKMILKRKLREAYAIIFSSEQFGTMASLTRELDPRMDDLTMDLPSKPELTGSPAALIPAPSGKVKFVFSSCDGPDRIPADPIAVTIIGRDGNKLDLGYSIRQSSMSIDREILRQAQFIFFCPSSFRCGVVDLRTLDINTTSTVLVAFAPMSFI